MRKSCLNFLFIVTDDQARWSIGAYGNQEALTPNMVHFNAPHPSYASIPEVDWTPFRNLLPTVPSAPGISNGQLQNLYREYYASVHSIDRNIGRLLDRLEQLKLDEKTITVLTVTTVTTSASTACTAKATEPE